MGRSCQSSLKLAPNARDHDLIRGQDKLTTRYYSDLCIPLSYDLTIRDGVNRRD